MLLKKNRNFNKQRKGKRIKILTPKQMLQKLQILFLQVKADNRSENLLMKLDNSYLLCTVKN